MKSFVNASALWGRLSDAVRRVTASEFMKRRSTRLVVFGAAVLTVAAVLAPYAINHVSSSAYVNAELVRVHAPIAGSLDERLPEDGAFIAEATRIPLLEALAPDRGRLIELESERAANTELTALLTAQVAEISARSEALSARFDTFAAASRSRLGSDLSAIEARLDACRREASRLDADREAAATLAARDLLPELRLREAETQHEVQERLCTALDAERDSLRTARDAAQEDVFLSDGFNDAPYSQQQIDRLILHRQELETRLLRARRETARLVEAVAAERERLHHASEYELSLPAGHVVWTVMSSPGTSVVAGQPILELADCRRRFVSVEMSERAVSAIHPGDPASVRLVGTRRWIDGEVTQVLGSAARRSDRMLAADIPAPDAKQFLVEVALPADALSEADNNRCHVGRLAEVRFSRFSFAGLFRSPAAYAKP